MKRIALVIAFVMLAGCASLGKNLDNTGAQSGVADKTTGDRLTATEFTAVKTTADTADALATVNQGKLASEAALETALGIGIAHSGANSDITSLSGLTTPLTAAQGGVGADTSAMSGLSKMTNGVVSVASQGVDYQGVLTGGVDYLRPTTDVDDVAVNGVVSQPISSNWAYDHENAANPHSGSAASGANSDITSLSGLTTPLTPGQGGVGADTSSMNGLAKMTNGVVSEAAAGTDYQSDLAVPSEAQAEDRTSSTEYVWTPEKIGNAIQDFLADNGLAVEGALAAEPAGEHVGQIVLADNDTWDPSSVTGTTPYWAICTATGTPGTWVAWLSVGGTWLYENIDIATLKASELNDTSDPHLLTDNELGSHYISNSESIGADEWDFPAAAEGWDFCFVKEANQNVTLDPNGTETWYFRTDNSAYTALSAGEAIVNTTSGKSVLCCFSTDAPDVFCTGDANWAEETP